VGDDAGEPGTGGSQGSVTASAESPPKKAVRIGGINRPDIKPFVRIKLL